jgi:hypothetical protein
MILSLREVGESNFGGVFRLCKLKGSIIVMGICNNKQKDGDLRSSTKAILKADAFDTLQFYFTTENLLRIDGDCLVLYCDEKLNINKNTFITKIGKYEARKIQEFAESHLLASKKKLAPGDIIFFPISISTLQFRFIGMVCLKTWDGNEKVKVNLEPIMTNLFADLKKNHVQSLAITEFNEHFGVPSQTGCRMLSDALFNNREWLKIVTVICNDLESQSYYMERIEHYTKLLESSVKTSDATSQYY